MQLLTMPRTSHSAPIYKAAAPAQGNARMFAPAAPAAYAAPRPGQNRLAPQPCFLPVTRPEDPSLPRDVASRFGRRVRELRQARAMTQVEVAVHFGIDRTFISDVERGRKSVCLPTMEVFALGFGLSLSDLLRGI